MYPAAAPAELWRDRQGMRLWQAHAETGHSRGSLTPAYHLSPGEGALQFGLLRKHNENSSRSRRAASPIPARAAGRIQKPANAGDSSQAGVSEP